jgi:hypothetical protein
MAEDLFIEDRGSGWGKEQGKGAGERSRREEGGLYIAVDELIKLSGK